MNVGFLVAALPGHRSPALAGSACLLSGHVQPKTILFTPYTIITFDKLLTRSILIPSDNFWMVNFSFLPYMFLTGLHC